MDPDVVYQRRWWSLAVLCLSLIVVIVGNTVLNVALPTLVAELDATATQLQWIVDSYALVFAGLLLTAGALGDRFGRKGAMIVGLLIFGAASAVSALATSADQLIVTRAVMGLGAALVMPATLSILTTVFPPQERAKAIAVWAGLAGAGGALGPIASGWLLESYSWGSVFLVNIPLVVLALVAGRWLVPTSKDPAPQALDPIGALLSIVGLAALLYALIEAPTFGWTSVQTLAAFSFAVLVLVGFAVWELRREHPMLQLRLFRNPALSSASGAITLVFFAMFGTFFLFTQYLQLVLGYTPLQAGLRTLPLPLTLMVIAPQTSRLVERFGPRAVVRVGLTVVAVGLALLSGLGLDPSYAFIAGSLVVLAFGMALGSVPATTSIMASVPQANAGVGSAINDTTRELGGALGVAVMGSLLASQYVGGLDEVLAQIPPVAAAQARSSLGAALTVAQTVGGEAGQALGLAARVSFTDAMALALRVAAGVALVAGLLVGRFLPGRVERPQPATAPSLEAAPVTV